MNPSAPLPLLALAIFAANMGLGIIFPLIPHLAAGGPEGAAAVGWIFSSYAITLVIAQIIGGALADRLDAARVLSRALALYFITLLLFTVARGIPFLMVVRALEGFAVGLIVPCVMKLVVRSVPPERLGRGIGTVMGLGGLGFIAGPLIGGYLAPIGLQLPFLAAASVAGIAASASVIWLPAGPGEPTAEPLSAEFAKVGTRLKDATFWGLVLPLIAVKINFSTMQAGLPLIGDQVLGVDLPHVSWLFVITAVAYALAQALAGQLADRFATRWLITGAFLLMAPLLVLLANQTSYTAFLLPYALFSLAQCASVLFAMKHLGAGLGETSQGRAFGLASAVGDMGMIVAPSALLPLFAWRHPALLIALAGVMIACLLPFLVLSRRRSVVEAA
ncbi:MAG: blt9 [Cyanobacteria bacterium RYN_339]|nr:blt9 [Cyanobacteria bacterium RYN_339]